VKRREGRRGHRGEIEQSETDASREKDKLTVGLDERLDAREGVVMRWRSVGGDIEEKGAVVLLSLVKREEKRDEAMADLSRKRKRDAVGGSALGSSQ